LSFKVAELYTANNLIVLQYIRRIKSTDASILLSIQEDYQALTIESSFLERATCSLIASILLQERVYYIKTREGFRSIMKRDSNLINNTKTFSDRDWSKLLSFWYENNIIELLIKGDKRNAAIYQVKHPKILSYLNTKVDAAKQFEEIVLLSEKYKASIK
jgi:hypothetical protein